MKLLELVASWILGFAEAWQLGMLVVGWPVMLLFGQIVRWVLP